MLNKFERSEMKSLKGGDCGCACAHSESGGSATMVNMAYNGQSGLSSSESAKMTCTEDVEYEWSSGKFHCTAGSLTIHRD